MLSLFYFPDFAEASRDDNASHDSFRFFPQIIKKLIERKQAQIRKVYPGLTCFKEGVRHIPIESIPGIRELSRAYTWENRCDDAFKARRRIDMILAVSSSHIRSFCCVWSWPLRKQRKETVLIWFTAGGGLGPDLDLCVWYKEQVFIQNFSLACFCVLYFLCPN